MIAVSADRGGFREIVREVAERRAAGQDRRGMSDAGRAGDRRRRLPRRGAGLVAALGRPALGGHARRRRALAGAGRLGRAPPRRRDRRRDAAPARRRRGASASSAASRSRTPTGRVTALDELWSDASVRMNEGGCDPDGRFYCGSMAYDQQPGAAVAVPAGPRRLGPRRRSRASRSPTASTGARTGRSPTTTTPRPTASTSSTTTAKPG